MIESIDRYEAKYGRVSDEDKARMFSPEIMRDRENMLRISSLARQSDNILEALLGMYVVTASPFSSRKQFVVSSNPVIRLYNSKERHIQKGDVEIWTTISHNLAVGFMSKPVELGPAITLPDHSVEHLNTELLRQSGSVASKNRKLLESLVSKLNNT